MKITLQVFSLFFRHLFRALLYSAPSQIVLFLLVRSVLTDAPWQQILTYTLIFLATNTLYVYANIQNIVTGVAPKILTFMRWMRHHSDFLIFVNGGIMIVGGLSIYLIDVAITLYEINQNLEEQRVDKGYYAYQFRGIAVLAFGSKISILLSIGASIWAWVYFCRVGIRIPAYVAGYYMRTEVALDLTRAYILLILILSLLFIVPSVGALFLLPDATADNARFALSIALVYFILMQTHMCLWIALFREVTRDYKYMGKVTI